MADKNAKLYSAIGEFIFWFSQLEGRLKYTLAASLDLKPGQFDVVVSPYDFAVLCTVAEKTLKLDFDEEFYPAIRKFFNECRKLNSEVRIVVAHGSWTSKGARHVSRGTLEAKTHFEKPEKLREAAQTAKKLLMEFEQMGAVSNR